MKLAYTNRADGDVRVPKALLKQRDCGDLSILEEAALLLAVDAAKQVAGLFVDHRRDVIAGALANAADELEHFGATAEIVHQDHLLRLLRRWIRHEAEAIGWEPGMDAHGVGTYLLKLARVETYAAQLAKAVER